MPTEVKCQALIPLVHKSLYGQQKAGRIWNKHLHGHLMDLGFKQSDQDACVYFRGRAIIQVYVDDAILAGPSESDIKTIISQLQGRIDMTD